MVRPSIAFEWLAGAVSGSVTAALSRGAAADLLHERAAKGGLILSENKRSDQGRAEQGASMQTAQQHGPHPPPIGATVNERTDRRN